MDMMEMRFRMMAMQESGLDTSPRIAEYDAAWGRGTETKYSYNGWCITDWYSYDKTSESIVSIIGYIGNDNAGITFQYHNATKTQKDWYYFNKGDQEGEQKLVGVSWPVEISFSIQQSKIKDSYVYIKNTGQILFAGKNSIYYGHKNISELN